MRRIVVRLTSLLCMLSVMTSATADEADIRSLDEQVQEIKSDVLGIASELNNLEERLLYPSGTQVAVFVEMAEKDTFRLDAIQVHINGELAAHHIYSFKELEALEMGGVQRVYTGNVPTGQHEMIVSVLGKLKNGNEYQHAGTFAFTKGVEPKTLGITLAGPSLGDQEIQLGDW